MLERTFRTKDSSPVAITIASGGEQIENNTYDFAIEFCTHDSSVFAFTHVPVMEVGVRQACWTVETGSGNVLALVTGPNVFPRVKEAYAAKEMLAGALASSMKVSPSGAETLAALTLEELRNRWAGPQCALQAAADLMYGPGILTLAYNSWNEVAARLTERNVDDGINIKAALLRMARNQGNWDAYVGSTVLCRSDKDWGVGYVSRVTMPMTLVGYFVYVAKVKLPRSDSRIEEIVELDEIENTGNRALGRRVTTWFWSSLIAGVCNSYVQRLIGADNMAISGIAPDVCDIDPDGMTFGDLQGVAFLYLIASKTLTGALGALSEPAQGKLQKIAWEGRSTEGMGEQAGKSYQELLMAQGVTSTEWVEYHSTLKDLTGLWFKGTLQQVMCCEGFTPLFCRRIAVELRDHTKGSVWRRGLKERLQMLEEPRWDNLYDNRKGFEDDLREHRWMALVEQIAIVEDAIADEMDQFADWCELYPTRASYEYAYSLAEQPERRSLRYGEGPKWEGRYETMADAIPNEAIDRWTYPVEHRSH
jgi:hypothetical protein